MIVNSSDCSGGLGLVIVVEKYLSLVEFDATFLLAVTHFNSRVAASLDVFSDAVEICRIMHGSCNDVFIADYSVGWCLIYFWVSCLGEGIGLTVYFAFYELDSAVELFKFDCPMGLLWSISGNYPEVFEASVVCMYFYPMLRT